jgi:hypothetical protein
MKLRDEGSWVFFLLMTVGLVLSVVWSIGANFGGSQDDQVLRAPDANGFTDINIRGHGWFACSDSDQVARAFTATNSRGHRVDGAVCCGVLKACTVRF